MIIVDPQSLAKGKKLHYKTFFQGLPISIENRAGSLRRWFDPKKQKHGETKMVHPYGYIRGTIGADDDHLDCFIGPHRGSQLVFIVNQRFTAHLGKFDEHKVFLGWRSLEEAKAAFLDNYDAKGPELLGSIREWTMPRFKRWLAGGDLSEPAQKSTPSDLLKAGGPYLGPRGGLWADPKHTVPWKADYHNQARNEGHIEALGRHFDRAMSASSEGDKRYAASSLHEHGVDITPHKKLVRPTKVVKEKKALYHATPAFAMDSIREHGLRPRQGAGLFQHGGYDPHSQGKVFFASDEIAAQQWHHKVQMQLEHHHDEPEKHQVVQLRIKHRRSVVDPVGDRDVYGSRYVKQVVPPEHIEFKHDGSWKPIAEWGMKKSLFTVSRALFKGEAGGQHSDHKYVRRWRERGRWKYDYPGDTRRVKFTFTERYEKSPHLWEYVRSGDKDPRAWTKGGIVPTSAHPVKEAGVPHRLYQIVAPGEQPGWARLKDMATGETKLVQHNRIWPVRRVKAKVAPPPPVAPPKAPSKPWKLGDGIGKPPSPTEVSEGATRLPAFAQSTAAPGTALAAIEGGKFLVKHSSSIEHDEGGERVQVRTRKAQVDNATKTKLIAEFEGMVVNLARDAQRRFRLKPEWERATGERRKDLVLEDLHMAAVEGFLTAIDRYPGGLSFAGHAQFYARDFVSMHAAKLMSGNVSIPAREQRLVQKYVAARAKASRNLDVGDPSPEQVTYHWRLLKRDVHSLAPGDPQRMEEVPADSYSLAGDTRVHPGTAEWADRIHSFLAGQRTAQDLDFLGLDEAALPGLHIGAGMSDADKVEVRQAITRSIADLQSHEIEVSGASYRANTGEILQRVLGLTATGEGQSIKEIAGSVAIERKLKGGWKKLSLRQGERIAPEFVLRGLAHARKSLGGAAEGLIKRAAAKFEPLPEVKRGPTFGQILEARSRKVTASEVADWRRKARAAYAGNAEVRRHVDSMGERAVRVRIAHEQMIAEPMSAQMRKLMTQHVSLEPTSKDVEYGSAIATITDPSTGAQKRVRVATMRDIAPRPVGALVKAEVDTEFTTGMLWAALHFPLTTELFFSKSAPSAERHTLETLMGLH